MSLDRERCLRGVSYSTFGGLEPEPRSGIQIADYGAACAIVLAIWPASGMAFRAALSPTVKRTRSRVLGDIDRHFRGEHWRRPPPSRGRGTFTLLSVIVEAEQTLTLR
jgi:hypothetical protein